jgi:CheY-like chemotaxis protein
MSRILFVDDDEVNREVLFEVFDDSGHELAEAESGEQALELIESWRPEVVLLDIMMPGLDGYETCRRIREHEGMADTKIILVSAMALLSERIAGYEAGADDYVTKPFEMEELRAKVQVFARLHRAEQLDELKDGLLSFMAHEVRTPMTAILPAVEFLKEADALSAAERGEFAEMIQVSADRLLESADRALLYAELRSGREPKLSEPLDLAMLIEERILPELPDGSEVRDELGGGCALRLDVALLGKALAVLCEELRSLQCCHAPAVLRLVRAAEGPQIRVSCSEPGHAAAVHVALPSELRIPVADSDQVYESLGLMLVAHIAALHGGSLSILEGEGLATTFVIALNDRLDLDEGDR